MHRTPLSAALLIASTLALGACSSGSSPSHDGEAAHASSSAGLPDGNAAAGRALANTKNAVSGQSCIDCHGADGNKPIDPTYPKIGGQYHDYLARALQAYRGGDRAGSATTDLMGGQAKDLTDQQIADLAAYFGSAPGELRDLAGLD